MYEPHSPVYSASNLYEYNESPVSESASSSFEVEIKDDSSPRSSLGTTPPSIPTKINDKG